MEKEMFQGGKKNNAAYTNQFKLLLTLAVYLQMARGNGFYELTKWETDDKGKGIVQFVAQF